MRKRHRTERWLAGLMAAVLAMLTPFSVYAENGTGFAMQTVEENDLNAGTPSSAARALTPSQASYRQSISAQELINYMNAEVGKTNQYQGWCLLYVTKCFEGMGFRGAYGLGSPKQMQANGYIISTSKENIPIGADVFFDTSDNGHIGIYIGDGYFVHAGSSSVYQKSNLITQSYYSARYMGWGWHPYVTVEQPVTEGTLDLNWQLDGTDCDGSQSYGTADVYINGSLAADDVSDFCQQFPAGTTYEIGDIKAASGYAYNGLTPGSDTLTGTVAADVTRNVRLSFSALHTVRFVTAHGITPSSQQVKHGAKATDPGNLTAAGYTFGGWYADSAYQIPWDFSSRAVTENTVIYAKWTVRSFRVTFKTGVGKSIASQTVQYGKYAADPGTPKATGYAFAGWYADSAFKTCWNFAENKITKNTVIYAKWTPYTYTVKFSGNGASSGNMKSLTGRVYGKTFSLTANAYKKTGYAFIGWNTKKSGTGNSYTNGASVKNLTAKKDVTVTLYAQWSKKYSITYVLNGGTNNSKNPASYTEEDAVSFLAPSKPGYVFGGWYTDSWYQTKITKLLKGTTGNKKLYARWTRASYTISFNGNGASSGTVGSLKNCRGGNTYRLPANQFRRTGYTFTGWNTKADGKGAKYADQASVRNLSCKKNGTVTLYAQWEANTYTIRFSANGGTGTMAQIKAAYGKAVKLKACTMKKSGKLFAGWNTKADGSGKTYADGASVKNLTAKNGRTVTLYAQWGTKSGWVLASKVPKGATITDRKWRYTKVETTASDTQLSGWTVTGESWQQTGTGSSTYAVFPGGYPAGDSLYGLYSGKGVSAFENAEQKRVITGENRTSYVYWHWTYTMGYLSGGYNCFVSEQPGSQYISRLGRNLNFQYFSAFESASEYGHSDPNGAYDSTVFYAWRDNPADGSWWWFRIPVYTQNYTDYKKIYQLEKRTEMTSGTKVTESSVNRNVREYVRYIR